MKIWDWSKGHWPQILAAHVGAEFVDGKHHPCPCGDGTDRFRFTDLGGQGLYFCHCSDGSKGGIELLKCCKGVDFKGACELIESVIGECPRDKEEAKPQPQSWAQRLRREVVKTKRSAYLEGRGLEVPSVLDWHKSLPYYDDGKEAGRYPAMLAPVMHKGQFLTYHATYLDAGGKAPVNPNRKLLPGKSNRGAAVPLYEPKDGVIGVAEGIETAIAAKLLFGVPAWAALNTAMLKNFEPPADVEAVIIYGDNDANHAGQAAAHALAHRLIGQGFDATVTFPEQVGHDWADVLLSRRAAA